MSGLVDRTRSLEKHFTVSGYVLKDDGSELLLVWHNRLKGWLAPGGHLEPNEIPHEGAMREVREETGVDVGHIDWMPVTNVVGDVEVELPSPLWLSYQLIPATPGVPEHVHLDMAFIFVGIAESKISPADGEVREARWFTVEEIGDTADVFPAVRRFARAHMSAKAQSGGR